ncbi:MAG TPA: hypothetical protein VE760_01420, partial [Acidimicrobiales bacterium]|nr:hypothetical protein [Acidimicrobiales bacterium]
AVRAGARGAALAADEPRSDALTRSAKVPAVARRATGRARDATAQLGRATSATARRTATNRGTD